MVTAAAQVRAIIRAAQCLNVNFLGDSAHELSFVAVEVKSSIRDRQFECGLQPTSGGQCEF